MPISRTVNKLLQRITGKTKTKPVNVVAKRFIQAFFDHGVEAAQIPRLMPSVKLDDLNSEKALLAVLTPNVLDQTARLFGIRSQWLEGVDNEIYEYRSCYKQPAILLDHLSSIKTGSENPLNFTLRVLSTTRQLDCNDPRQQLLAPVLVEKIAEISDEWIYRYHIYRDGFDWSHPPARKELKAITRLVYTTFHTPVPLFVVKPNEIEEILEGKLIPRKFLDGCQITNPSLEDYALTEEESGVAKEVAELPAVLKYIEEHKLKNLITAEPPQPVPPGEPISEPQAAPATVEQIAVVTKMKAVPVTTSPADVETTNDEALAALFDPVPVAALEKMFPAGGKWNSWAERAHRNGLKFARESRGKFNPYRAAIWFMNQGMQGWDLARCKRRLANNLPSRSKDYIHLLTDDIADL